MYDEMCLDTFLAQQEKLFREPVAESREEAEEFLSDCFATICKNLKEVRAYFKEEGADIAGMSSEELAEQAEVFALPDGRYLIVEALAVCFGERRQIHNRMVEYIERTRECNEEL